MAWTPREATEGGKLRVGQGWVFGRPPRVSRAFVLGAVPRLSWTPGIETRTSEFSVDVKQLKEVPGFSPPSSK